MKKWYGVRGEEVIKERLVAEGVPGRTARSVARRITKEYSKRGGRLPGKDLTTIVGKVASRIAPGLVIKAATMPLMSPVPLLLVHVPVSDMHRVLFPDWTIDQWLEFQEELDDEGTANAGSCDVTYVDKRQGACDLKVICRTVVTACRNASKSRILKSSKFGATVYEGVEVVQGTVTSVDNDICCFTHIIIKIAIHINMAKVGTKWKEKNDTVKDEREQAEQQTSFKEVPYEFVLMHEEEHAKEAGSKLAPIAEPFLRCDKVDEKGLQDALAAEWEQITQDADDVDGATETRIRRETWDRWDAR